MWSLGAPGIRAVMNVEIVAIADLIGIRFERMDLVYFTCKRSTISRMLSYAKAARGSGTYLSPGRRF